MSKYNYQVYKTVFADCFLEHRLVGENGVMRGQEDASALRVLCFLVEVNAYEQNLLFSLCSSGFNSVRSKFVV